MHRLRLAFALAAVLLAGCTSLHPREADDEDDALAVHDAAAFLGYHGPVERPHWD